MTSKPCRDTRREIDELELGERPSQTATAHLATCAGCREFRTERTDLRELVGSLERVGAPADFDMRLRARLHAERATDRQQPFFARLLSTPALATAALLVMAAGSLVWITQRKPSSPTQPTTVATINNSPTTTSVKSNEPPVNESGVTPPSHGSEVVAVNDRNNQPHRSRGVRPVQSADFAARPVDRIPQDDRAFVPSRPVEFSLQDERGNTRKISLPPVSFGAQSLVDNRTNVSYSPNSRVW